MQHIINPLNMLPQDISKTRSLVWFPKTSKISKYGFTVKLLMTKMKMEHIPHASGYQLGKVRKKVFFSVIVKMICDSTFKHS